MKLNTRDAARYIAKPEPDRTGILIYGADAMRVALSRERLVKALIGPGGAEEMRLTRISGAELRRDPAWLPDAIKAQGFFPGARVALVDEANDFAAPAIDAALADWAAGDAQIVVTAGALKPTSKIRKAFESHANAYALGLYDDPPSRDEVASMLREAGLTGLDRAPEDALFALAQDLGPGDFRQLLDKIALYKRGDDSPLAVDEVAALAPVSTEAEIDAILDAAAESRAADIGPILARLEAQGVQPVALSIGAARHFRALHGAVVDPKAGPGRVPWKRRDAMLRQAGSWSAERLEQALGLLVETDLTLRSASQAPAMAVMERAFIRIAMMRTR